MRKQYYAVAALALALLATGCKPTESNYKSAYDVAQKKRQAASTDPDMVIPSGGIKMIGEPEKKKIGNDSVYVKAEHLKLLGETDAKIGKWNVAVSKYRMPTNCASQVRDLESRGYKAFAVENPEGTFYVIAGSFDNLGEAVTFLTGYRKDKEATVFVGLPGEPMLIERR